MTLVAPIVTALLYAAVLSPNSVQTPGVEQPDSAQTACTEIVTLARQLPGLAVRLSEGIVRDDKTGSNHNGCRVIGAGESVEYRDNGWPHDILRMQMKFHNWREDISRAADGAGSTAFALRKGVVLCLFSSIWNTDDLRELETLVTASYKFEIRCFEDDLKPANNSMNLMIQPVMARACARSAPDQLAGYAER